MKVSSALGLRIGAALAAMLLWLRFSEQAASISLVHSLFAKDVELGANLSELPWLSVGVYLWAISIAFVLYRPIYGAIGFLITCLPIFYTAFDGYDDGFLFAAAALTLAPLCIWADILANNDDTSGSKRL